jgi:hypothetical protein
MPRALTLLLLSLACRPAPPAIEMAITFDDQRAAFAGCRGGAITFR